MTSEQMRAAVLHTFGAIAPVVEQVAIPTVREHDVLIRVAAAGLNPIDNGIRLGLSPYAQPMLPAIVGTDVAGTVVAVGSAVTAWNPGDRVFGLTGGVTGAAGSLADFQAVDARLLGRVPDEMTLRDAAALGLVGLTAWEGVDFLGVRAGTSLLVQGGAGGVGHLVVQIGVALGARVYATTSAKNAEYVRSLGATPIDYATTAVEQYVAAYADGDGFDAVYDTHGGQTLLDSFLATRPYGRVASCAAFAATPLKDAALRGLTVKPIYVLLPLISGVGRETHLRYLQHLSYMAATGKVHPRVDPRHFTFDTVADAYAAQSDGSAATKIVVEVGAE